MRTQPITLIVLSLLLTINIAFAKGKQHEKHMDPQAMMELYKKLATPGEPHKVFASLAGNWTTKTKEWMEPGKPPMESEGTVEMKMLLDGRYLQQEYHGTMMGQPFTGISINAYDNLTKHYVTTWMSTTGTGIFTMEGSASADGKTITLEGKHPEPGGGHMSHLAIWKIVDNNTQTFDMYGAHHGGKEMKMMEIVYTKKP
ncbi:hypothetical protein MGMO_15c00590 [Methyloglobulus morosus KoM1]|uniref:DUF1579 domain-containing protein n=1 Tax=Methyloglobulus morosus KoM1 TaxID=1116472 RepID=V5CA12_9GAMM|nr:DUF1579 domain-containing protein [Methyloglobulus morosus]ESS73638.1 hypothetical protein MGMO_15c00590 [Methyloglobulus morosus KoM1]